MATPAVQLQGNLVLNLSQAERQVRAFEQQALRNLGRGGQPLGRLTAKVTEFDKSMEAANARVVAFGASAAVIVTVTTAIREMVTQAIAVEKAFADINVLMGLSNRELQKFSDQLFSVARNTGQAFDIAAEAAKEFSRQGLSAEETLKRTNSALILTRLSGLDAAKSVETLTAAVNSFNREGISHEEIVNRMANVDAKFAVSSKDLADGLARAGGSAQDAGVSFNELLALVTAVQQRTARGGAVIGNALKTIFTRLQRSDTLDQLESLGFAVRDIAGQTLPAVEILGQLAKSYDQLGASSKSFVAELVGGGYQINILKGLFGDLGQVVPEFARALDTANNSTNQAIARNEELNKTLASLANAAQVNFTKLAASAGKLVFGPTLERVLGQFNEFSDQIDGQGIGEKIGSGILSGIGHALAGPGLVFGAVLGTKLFAQFAKFSTEAVGSLAGVGKASERVQNVEKGINDLIGQRADLHAIVTSRTATQLEKENAVLRVIREQVAAKNALAQSVQGIAGNLVNTAGLSYSNTKQTFKGRGFKSAAAGYVPVNNIPTAAVLKEVSGASKAGYSISPKDVRAMKGNINGKLSTVVYNTKEKVINNYGGSGEPAIIPPTGRIMNYAGGRLKIDYNVIEPRKVLKTAAEKAEHLLTELAGLKPSQFPKVKFNYDRYEGEMGRYERDGSNLINMSIPNIYSQVEEAGGRGDRRAMFDQKAGHTLIHEAFHAAWMHAPDKRKILEQAVRASPRGPALPKKLTTKTAIAYVKKTGGAEMAKYFKKEYKGTEVEEVLAHMSPSIYNYAGGGIPKMGGNLAFKKAGQTLGSVELKKKGEALILDMVTSKIGSDGKRMKGTGILDFAFRELFSRARAGGAREVGFTPINGRVIQKAQSLFGPKDSYGNPIDFGTDVRIKVGNYPNLFNAATGFGLESMSKAELLNFAAAIGVDDPALSGANRNRAEQIIKTSKAFKRQGKALARGRNLQTMGEFMADIPPSLTNPEQGLMRSMARNMGPGAAIAGLTPRVRSGFRPGRQVVGSRPMGPDPAFDTGLSYSAMTADQWRRQSARVGTAAYGPALPPMPAPSRPFGSPVGIAASESLLTPRQSFGNRFRSALTYSPKTAQRFGTAGFIGSMALPIAGGIVGSLGGQQFKRGAEGVSSSLGTGLALAAAFGPVGAVVGGVVGAFGSLNAILENLTPSFEDLQEKMVEEANKRQVSIDALQNIQGLSGQIQQGNLSKQGLASAVQKRADLLEKVSPEDVARILKSDFKPEIISEIQDKANRGNARATASDQIGTFFKTVEQKFANRTNSLTRLYGQNRSVVGTGTEATELEGLLGQSINPDNIANLKEYQERITALSKQFSKDANNNYFINGKAASADELARAGRSALSELQFERPDKAFEAARNVAANTAGTDDESNVFQVIISGLLAAQNVAKKKAQTDKILAAEESRRLRLSEAYINSLNREADILKRVSQINWAQNVLQGISSLTSTIRGIRTSSNAAVRGAAGDSPYLSEFSRNRFESINARESINSDLANQLEEISTNRKTSRGQVDSELGRILDNLDTVVRPGAKADEEFSGKGVITGLAKKFAGGGAISTGELTGLQYTLRKEMTGAEPERQKLFQDQINAIESTKAEYESIEASAKLQAESARAAAEAQRLALKRLEEITSELGKQRQLASLFDFGKLVAGSRDISSIGRTSDAQNRALGLLRQGRAAVGTGESRKQRTARALSYEDAQIGATGGLLGQLESGLIPKRDQIRALLQSSGQLKSFREFDNSGLKNSFVGDYAKYSNSVIDNSVLGRQLGTVERGLATGFTAAGRRDIRSSVGAYSNTFLSSFAQNGLRGGLGLNDQFRDQFQRAAANGDIGVLRGQAESLRGAASRPGTSLINQFIERLETQQQLLNNLGTQGGAKALEAVGGRDISDNLTNSTFVERMDKLIAGFTTFAGEVSKQRLAPAINIPSIQVTITAAAANAKEVYDTFAEANELILNQITTRLAEVEKAAGVKRPPVAGAIPAN